MMLFHIYDNCGAVRAAIIADNMDFAVGTLPHNVILDCVTDHVTFVEYPDGTIEAVAEDGHEPDFEVF